MPLQRLFNATRCHNSLQELPRCDPAPRKHAVRKQLQALHACAVQCSHCGRTRAHSHGSRFPSPALLITVPATAWPLSTNLASGDGNNECLSAKRRWTVTSGRSIGASSSRCVSQGGCSEVGDCCRIYASEDDFRQVGKWHQNEGSETQCKLHRKCLLYPTWQSVDGRRSLSI
ncbi:hypothetical protein LEMLEM_LOCUS14304 [Lemmus lemmus]